MIVKDRGDTDTENGQSTGSVEPAGMGLAPVATRQWLRRGSSYRTLVRVEHQIRKGKDRNYALCFTLSLLL